MLFEWLRGPRRRQELTAQEALFPSSAAVVFGPAEAAKAAALYRTVSRPHGREVDLAIAACAICHNATLWTLSIADFADLHDLTVTDPRND